MFFALDSAHPDSVSVLTDLLVVLMGSVDFVDSPDFARFAGFSPVFDSVDYLGFSDFPGFVETVVAYYLFAFDFVDLFVVLVASSVIVLVIFLQNNN